MAAGANAFKTLRIRTARIVAAKKIWGRTSAEDTIETALHMVVFRRELTLGIHAMFGVTIASPDAE